VATGTGSLEHLDSTAIDWLRVRAKTIRRVCSICVGAFALAEAGLLDGRRATTHWAMANRLAERYPAVQVDPNPIWVKDGNLYTSAGISAGIDLALALVGEDLGNSVALELAKGLVLFLRRPGGQAQFSVSLQAQKGLSPVLDGLRLWVNEHLGKEITVEMLAEVATTSVRTLVRMFQREMKTTPAKYVEEVRLEAVCQALELGGRSLESIARRYGYQSVDVLRRAFVRRLGVTPKEYAQRFAIAATGPDGIEVRVVERRCSGYTPRESRANRQTTPVRTDPFQQTPQRLRKSRVPTSGDKGFGHVEGHERKSADGREYA